MTEGHVSYDPRFQIALAAAEAAGGELLRRWDLPISGRSSKSTTTDEVSDADRSAETVVVEAIRAAFPADAVVSEEGGGAKGTSMYRWLVDPLDGTINYLYGIPQWAVSIACADPDGPLIGVVHSPARGETFFAERGKGAWLRPPGDTASARRLHVTSLDDLSLALLATGFSYSADERREQARREVGILPRIRDVRRLGSAALDLAFVAAARLDGYCEAGGNEWDWAAGRLLVTEAGGRVSEAPGVRAGLPTLIASGSGIHDELVGLVMAVQKP